MLGRSLQRTRHIALLGLALAMVGYCAFLLRDLYRSHNQLLALARERTLLDAEKEASALGYFFAERKEDLEDLANNRDLLAYFENEALGMSMEYGLGASLDTAAEAFRKFRTQKRLGNLEIYTRIAFLTLDGKPLLATSIEENFQKTTPRRPLSLEGEHPRFTLLTVGDVHHVMVQKPYRFKGQLKGMLVAQLPIEPVFQRFSGTESATKSPMGLLFEHQWVFVDPSLSRLVPRVVLPDAARLEPQIAHAVDIGATKAPIHELHALRIPITESPFSLVAFLPTLRNQDKAPLRMITVASVVGAIILLGAFALFREESRRRLLNARFRAVFDNAGLAICLMDSSWRFEEVNARFSLLFGHTQSEFRRMRILDLAHPEDRALASRFQKTILNGPADRTSFEHRFLAKDGSLIWGSVFTTTIRSGHGQPEAVVAIVIDLTEAKQMEHERLALETQLLRAQKREAVGRLAAGLAHEINTPIQFIGDNTAFLEQTFRGFRDMIAAYVSAIDALNPPASIQAALEKSWAATDMTFLLEEAPKSIRQIREGTQRVSRIILALQEFSRPGNGRPEPVNLNHAIENTASVSKHGWESAAELVLDLDPTLPLVTCIPDEINQTILSLLMNAADAIAESADSPASRGVITLSTRQHGSNVEIRVKDTGPGIPEAIQAQIFEPFFSTKAVGKGTGQGLAIAYHAIVETHGGTIQFETTQGAGTTFVIRLPLMPEVP